MPIVSKNAQQAAGKYPNRELYQVQDTIYDLIYGRKDKDAL